MCRQFPEQKLRPGHDIQLMPGTEGWEGWEGGWAAVGRADDVSVLNMLWACLCVCVAFSRAKWENGRGYSAELQMGTIFGLFILWTDELDGL